LKEPKELGAMADLIINPSKSFSYITSIIQNAQNPLRIIGIQFPEQLLTLEGEEEGR